MARPMVSEELWEVVEPLIPTVERRFRHPGGKRIHDREVVTGILFVATVVIYPLKSITPAVPLGVVDLPASCRSRTTGACGSAFTRHWRAPPRPTAATRSSG
jgi:hypothetical protein